MRFGFTAHGGVGAACNGVVHGGAHERHNTVMALREAYKLEKAGRRFAKLSPEQQTAKRRAHEDATLAWVLEKHGRVQWLKYKVWLRKNRALEDALLASRRERERQFLAAS